MARRKNPWVTLAMLLGLVGFGTAAHHYINVVRLFDSENVAAPPAAEMDRLRTSVEEALAADECFGAITSFNWRETSKRYRVDVAMSEGCGSSQAKLLAKKVSDLIARASSGRYEAEVSLLILGREVHHYVP
jgi:hypothetical protein